ncbi:VPLPA-CTERM sorting domain-containing protein [Litoreibacter ponti]|nr:VPLPA-CTERM sorting domain-containing protein [Litoreibacter ponti]
MKFLAATVAATVLATSAMATPINPDVLERNARGGDYPESSAGAFPNIGVGAIGQTSVVGDLVGECVALQTDGCDSGNDPEDVFEFEIGAGTKLTGLSIIVEGSGPSGFLLAADIFQIGTSFEIINDISLNTTVGLLGGQMLGQGTYRFVVGGFISTELGDWGGDYRLTGTVAALNVPEPVPLPASLPLLLAGIGGLAYLRRHRT